ncbi:hypothetical protein [Roseateles saccharophilus]|uniref:Uncharacterized protein n=1 Tax=Roseateles saccharophilus TaxID=304 RepID=A0A4R3UIJ2_ROSSA|nr:hypothetical protein [Roseateles saccharophilus]MDG0834851.1 hypothetical protein [Roseateles saccharophilus]TCU88385.1 hypothetical protein EV671_103911 [Roseateles saccharophilus]
MKFQLLERTPQRGDTGICLRIGKLESPLCRLGTFVVCLATLTPTASHAVDGCTVLLCLAAPSWRSISQCVPPVVQAFRDLARGKPFPTCAMAGAGNSASHTWSSAPSFCPPQYTHEWPGPNRSTYTCDFSGAISVSINGAPFSQTWWSASGDTVTSFSAAAKAQLGSWDTRFDDDYAAWLASQPAPVNAN